MKYPFPLFTAIALLVCLAACTTTTHSEKERAETFTLHRIFSSHMVLQRREPLRISGTAEASRCVLVHFNGKTQEATADKNGEWIAEFPAMEAGGPYELLVEGCDKSKIIRLDDILIGEVWLCSGQSNMQMPVKGGRFWQVRNSDKEVKNANHPQLRLFEVKRIVSPGKILPDVPGGSWQACTPESVRLFSAAAYFFGRQLQKDLGVPVGLIHASWGGTPIEPWISESAYEKANRHEIEAIRFAKAPSPEQKERLRKSQEKVQREMDRWTERFLQSDPARSREAQAWKQPSYDDSAWSASKKPAPFPDNIDGVGWYRHSVEIPPSLAGRDMILHLGVVDDCDETFFNGVQIGRTDTRTPGYWTAQRVYPIPGKLVKAGKNGIAVRAIDHFSGGGFRSPGYLEVKGSGEKISIAEGWKFKLEFAVDPKKIGPRPVLPAHHQNLKSPSFPATLFNSMIAPWTRYPIRGIIWYQGCSNAGSMDYYPLHKLLIQDWRRQWNNPEMPFLLVQLAGFEKHTPVTRLPDDYWKKKAPMESVPYALTREIQAEMCNLPFTGMAVAMDVGDHSDIHPADKQTVGYRLAKEAERVAYHADHASQGPVYAGMKAEGGKIRVFFRNVGKGLTTKDGKAPGAFAIAGKDGRYVWADAVIDGDTVVVSSESVKEPVGVRYAWVQYRGDVNLCNRDGFPAVPFRSDKPEYR